MSRNIFPSFSWYVPLVILVVITSCCLNVVFLEAIIRVSPGSGNLITFSQFLFIAVEGFLFTTSCGRKTPAIPIKKYLLLVIFFFLVNVSNNYALNFNISVPLHIIFRSGSLMANMLLGILILKRRYPLSKYVSVAIITAGIIVATLASSGQTKAKSVETAANSTVADGVPKMDSWVYDYTIGISMLSFALIMSARLGIFQEVLFTTYGKHPKEAVFYQHALSLPGFVLMFADISVQMKVFNASEPSSVLNIPVLWLYLMVNMVTQYLCIQSVMALMSECTSLTTTLVLTIRKFISLVFSIYYFQNPFTVWHWTATGMVFAGSILFMDVPLRLIAHSMASLMKRYFRPNRVENVVTVRPLLKDSDKSSESD